MIFSLFQDLETSREIVLRANCSHWEMQFIFNDCFKKILQQHSHEDLKKWKENVDKNKENDSGFKAVMKYGIRIEKHELKLTKSRHTKFLDSTDLNMVSSYTDFTQKIQHSRFFFSY